VLVDDVLNTGRILSYAFAALLPYSPPKVEVAVLVARNHSLFPLKPDFIGHELSTTLEEHIEVRLGEGAFLR
jgi:pyrimidine operon attenuation protein / uracil phosphoribosyltransferase